VWLFLFLEKLWFTVLCVIARSRSKGGDAAILYGDVAFVVDENMTWIQVGEQIFISEAPGNLKEIATALWASQ